MVRNKKMPTERKFPLAGRIFTLPGRRESLAYPAIIR